MYGYTGQLDSSTMVFCELAIDPVSTRFFAQGYFPRCVARIINFVHENLGSALPKV